MAEELSESSERNFQKWPLLRSVSAWRTEVRQLKNWVRDRANWMDAQYLAPPRWDTQPGPVPEDGFVRFQSDGNDLYVTMDGTDPRLPGGGVAPSAQALSSRRAVVEVDQPLRLMARSYDNGRWSGLLEGYFVLPEPASLILSEIMYHPSDAAWVNTPWKEEDLEYLEIFNQGDRSIQLDGLALTQESPSPFHPGSFFQARQWWWLPTRRHSGSHFRGLLMPFWGLLRGVWPTMEKPLLSWMEQGGSWMR